MSNIRERSSSVHIENSNPHLYEELRLQALSLIQEKGVVNPQTKGVMFWILDLQVKGYSGIVEIEIDNKKQNVDFYAFTTGNNQNVIIDAGQVIDNARVRLCLYDWRSPHFVYPDQNAFSQGTQSPNSRDIEFYTKLIDAAVSQKP